MRGQLLPHSHLRLDVPKDAAGTRETLKHMRQLVQQDKFDLRNRDLANRITAQVPAKHWLAELGALLDFVRCRVRYALDTNDIETIQDSETTLRLGYGDCDDMAVLLSTLCECAGHPTAFAALGFQCRGEYSHVVVIASPAGEGNWEMLDPTEPQPVGWVPPGIRCAMLCPISETAENLLRG
jgi:transglutaminase-like putative cysteine protease